MIMCGTAHSPDIASTVNSLLRKELTAVGMGATYSSTPPLGRVETCAMRRFTKSKPVPVIANTTTVQRFNARMFKITGAMSSC